MMKKMFVVVLAFTSLARHAVADDQTATDPTVNPDSPVVVQPQYGSDQQVYHGKLVAQTEEEQAPEVSDDIGEEIPADITPDVQKEVPVVPSIEQPDVTLSGGDKAGSTDRSGIYVGIEGGLHHLRKSAPASAMNHVPDPDKVSTNGARVSLGYRINNNLALELGYMGGVTVHAEKETAQSTAHIEGADLTALYHMTDTLPGVYFRGGISYLNADISSSVTPHAEYRERPLHDYVHVTRYDREQSHGFGLVAGLGYETAVSEHVSLNAGYTRYQGVAGDRHNALDVVNLGAKYTF